MIRRLAKVAGGMALVVAAAAACDSAAESVRVTRPPPIASHEREAPEGSPSAAYQAEDDARHIAAPAGEDFVMDARMLLRVAACGGDEMVPARFDARAIDAHCKELLPEYERYRARWLEVAEPFLRSVVPQDLPPVVVYPFGGGDLLAALATFPNATEFVTMSLEAPGDVRAIETVPAAQIGAALAAIREHVTRRLLVSFLSTKNLGLEARAALPGELVLTLVALAIHGYEPTSLRYFDIEANGSLAYAFSATQNVELSFRARSDPRAPLRTLRHLSANLDNAHLEKSPGLVALLRSKAPFNVMTKAASHLLWLDAFSTLRQLLLERMAWMISDSTGIPPRFARAAGFVQDAYGRYEGPDEYGPDGGRDVEDFEELFRASPTAPLPFWYGYPDANRHGLVVVTRPGATESSAAARDPAAESMAR